MVQYGSADYSTIHDCHHGIEAGGQISNATKEPMNPRPSSRSANRDIKLFQSRDKGPFHRSGSACDRDPFDVIALI